MLGLLVLAICCVGTASAQARGKVLASMTTKPLLTVRQARVADEKLYSDYYTRRMHCRRKSMVSVSCSAQWKLIVQSDGRSAALWANVIDIYTLRGGRPADVGGSVNITTTLP